MNWKKRRIPLLLIMFISLFFAFGARAAVEPPNMWVASTETNGIPAQIDVFKSLTGTTYIYQLYLPGNADLEECFLSWDGDLQLTVDGVSYTSGSCPIPPVNTEKTYSFRNGSQTTSFKMITYQGSVGVPAVFIDIDESDGKPTVAQMDGDKEHNIECSGRVNINGQWYGMPKIKGRGNATWKESDDKKPYNITLDSKINFPGIDSAKTKKWTLLAEVLDRSLLCNRSGFHLAYEIGIGQDTASADVWMNGEYQGCYTVTPKTDSFVTKNGFMIEEDNYKEPAVANGGDPQFTLEGLKEAFGWDSCYNRITVKKMGDNLLLKDGVVDESPENMEAAAGEIQSWLQDAWDAMRSDTGYNDKGKRYTDYIDIESFAKMYLMHEYVKSYDICAGSILFHRDGQTDNDKLIAGPLWDLDNAMGSVYQNSSLGKADDRRNGDRRNAEGVFIQNVTEYKTSIYKTLYTKHEDFREEVEKQYNKNRSFFDDLSDDTNQMINEIDASARMNHIKVNDLGHNTGKDNHYYAKQTSLGSSPYQQTYLATTNSKTDWPNYAENLKTYITTRSLWFHNNYYDPTYVDPATCEHQYAAEITAATCTADGSVVYTCPICGDSYTETLPKIAHNYVDGTCSVCGEVLRTATITCDPGASVTVYETQDIGGAHVDQAASAHPRNSDTGLIDCSGDGQINFVVNLEPGYELESVTAAPTTAYKNLKGPDDTGIPNGYRLTKVSGDLTITVKVKTYTVKFLNEDGTELQKKEMVYGEMPVYDGGTPTKAATEDYYFTFSGWTPAIGAVTADATYTATYTATARTYGEAVWTWTGDDENGYTKAVATFSTNDGQAEFSFSETDTELEISTVAPTCEAAGKNTYSASVTFKGNSYSDTKEVSVSALGHEYESTVTTPTCTEGGYTTYTCSRCGESYKADETAALGHEYESDLTAPTCTEGGYTIYTCSRCGDSYKADESKPLGHDFGDWTMTTEPTCTAKGEERRICSRCDEEEIREIDALGHTPGDAVKENVINASCEKAGSYDEVIYCSVCDTEISREMKTIKALGHDWDEGIVTKEATILQEGEILYTCKNDPSHTKKEILSAKGNPFEDVPEKQYFYDPVLWAVETGVTEGTSANTFSPDDTCTRGQVVTFLWRAEKSPEPKTTKNPFKDVKAGSYYYKAVLWAVENGVTSGTSVNTFSPDAPCTRGQVVTFLWRAAGKPEPKQSKNPFNDVKAGDYYYKAVLWAVENNITGGTGNGKFSPSAPCTRGQVVTFLYRNMNS